MCYHCGSEDDWVCVAYHVMGYLSLLYQIVIITQAGTRRPVFRMNLELSHQSWDVPWGGGT